MNEFPGQRVVDEDIEGDALPHSPKISDSRPPHGANADIFFAAVKTTRMPMIVTDARTKDNPIIFCNAAFEHMTGYSEDEILGANCRFLQGPETDREIVGAVRRAVAEEEEIAVELLNYRKNGSTFWNALFVSPVYNEEGELLYFFGSQLDISRRREAEEALHQAQKMEAVGKLTGGIAHDFNNLLQVILGYTDILEARVPDGDTRMARAVEAIGAAASRGATLTQQLLSFARKQELRDRLLNFNSLIQDFRAIIEKTVGEDIVVRHRLADELWNCRVDPVQAEMAILNVIGNARDALDGQGGEIDLVSRNVVLPEEDDHQISLDPGEYVKIEICDNGPGFAEDVLPRVFDPFFSTKEVGKGTGLGLAMVYGFVRQSGGMAVADNMASGGARVSLYFPRASGITDRRTPHAVDRQPGGSERVLMVEDQEEVARLGRVILEDLGYSVVTAAHAREALDVLGRDDQFALLFTDIVMPGGMNGVELAQQVRRDYPRIQVLLATGYSDDAIDERSRSFELVRKPYRRADLDAKIRAILDRPGART